MMAAGGPMKWFQVDSDTPTDPRIRRIIRVLGNAGMGALFRVWCFVGAHGAEPGLAVDAEGNPYSDDDIADAAGMSAEDWIALRDLALEVKHFDPDVWRDRGAIFIPAQAKRADEYSRKRVRILSGDGSDNVASGSGKSRPTRQDTTRQNKTLPFGEGSAPEGAAPPSAEADELLALWNDTAKASDLPTARMTADRRIAAVRRLKERPMAEWRDIFARIKASKFLQGQNDRKWRVTFDWLLKNERNGQKVLEGAYENRAGATDARSGRTGSAKPGKYDAVMAGASGEVH